MEGWWTFRRMHMHMHMHMVNGQTWTVVQTPAKTDTQVVVSSEDLRLYCCSKAAGRKI